MVLHEVHEYEAHVYAQINAMLTCRGHSMAVAELATLGRADECV